MFHKALFHVMLQSSPCLSPPFFSLCSMKRHVVTCTQPSDGGKWLYLRISVTLSFSQSEKDTLPFSLIRINEIVTLDNIPIYQRISFRYHESSVCIICHNTAQWNSWNGPKYYTQLRVNRHRVLPLLDLTSKFYDKIFLFVFSRQKKKQKTTTVKAYFARWRQ